MKKPLFFLILLFSSTPFLGAVSSPWQSNPQGQVRLIAPYNTAPQDKTISFGVDFMPNPGWMVYWKNPGDAGFAPKFDFKGSRGFADAQIRWPRPQFFVLPGDIKEYGYNQEVVYPVVAQRTSTSGIHIETTVSYLTCRETCVPHKYTLILDIPADSEPSVDTPMQTLLQTFIQQVPPDNEDVLASLRPKKMSEETPSPGFWVFVLLSFIGGVILNVMPCVLPVLSIKLFGLVQHGGRDRRIVVRDTLASAAGIVISFLIGGVLLIVAKQAGHAVGWGIQFQSPGFVAILTLIVLIFAFNLWGVFEIPLPRAVARLGAFHADDNGPLSFFMSGIFAALLATPCSAPFLGTAMGFALTQPAGTILMVFFSAGMGMALPYFALAVFPRAMRWLPKPGAWMLRIKIFLGFLLAGTAMWLGWIFVQQMGLVKLGTSNTGPIDWVAFQEDKIPGILATGQPVFVDVTAAWCLTCKVNERFILRDPDIVAAFKQRNVVMMRADWTNQDTMIGNYLSQHGRAGIPFYALYEPQRDPDVLSELLTKKSLLRELQKSDAP